MLKFVNLDKIQDKKERKHNLLELLVNEVHSALIGQVT